MDMENTGGQPRVVATEATLAFIDEIRKDYPNILFHQSGGCCDGSSPMCYPQGDFLTSDADTLLGTIDVRAPGSVGEPEADDLVEVWMSANQFAYWRHTHLTIDLVPGRGAGFSLEGPTGFRFLIRSRLFTDDESAELGETPKVGLLPPP